MHLVADFGMQAVGFYLTNYPYAFKYHPAYIQNLYLQEYRFVFKLKCFF